MSPTKPTTCIENLPPEMISELFEYLHPKDLAACSMVNRRWQSIYAAFKLHTLAAMYYDPLSYKFIKWKGSNQPIPEAEQCRPAMFVRLADKPLLANLKYLVLCGHEFVWRFDLNKLNLFSQLVHLEIITRLPGNVHLNLPKLKVLAFDVYSDRFTVSIDCPELRTLAYYAEAEYANLLDVKHPETVGKLEINLVGPQLAQFKGVECLVTNEFKAISKATLQSLPRLKELHFNEGIHYAFGSLAADGPLNTVDYVKRTLNEFLNETKRLRGSDFQFTFAGFNMTNVNVDQIDFGVHSEGSERECMCKEYVYLKNYHLIEPSALHFIRRIDYTDLLRNAAGEFPRCFSQKFTDIQTVHVDDRIEDTDHLLWFLKSLRFLRSLELEYVELSQEFYDQLPTAAPSLVSLDLGGDWEKELQVNFDFIGRLTRLSILGTYQPLSLSSITSLVRWLGRLEEASICVRSPRNFSIEKVRCSLNEWKISYLGDTLFETEYPDKIVNFLEEGLRA